MTVIIDYDGNYYALTKGADSSVAERSVNGEES